MSKKIFPVLFLILSFQIFGESLNKDLLPKISEKEAAELGQFYTISILTYGPQKPVYVWWGHISIMVEDIRNKTERIYDYGRFSFASDAFYSNFAKGILDFEVDSSSARFEFNYIMQIDRSLKKQVLNLDPSAKYKVVTYLQNNVKFENRVYRYDHYSNNCCTKIRDILDMAVNGQLRKKTASIESELSLRELTQCYTKQNFFMDWFLMFLMGPGIDRKITIWEEMFLPDKLHDVAEDFYYVNAKGVKTKLVSSSETVKASDTYLILEQPGNRWLPALFIGIILGTVGAILFLIGSKKPVIRVLAGIYSGFWAFVLAILGSALLYMMTLSLHTVTYGNMNLLLVNPLLLIGFVSSIAYAVGTPAGKKINFIFWFTFALLAVGLSVAKGFGIVTQDNRQVLAVLVPFYTLMAFSCYFDSFSKQAAYQAYQRKIEKQRRRK